MSRLQEFLWDRYSRFYDTLQPIGIRIWGFFGEFSYEEFEQEFVELARLRPGSTALDVACGTGASHYHLSRAVGPRGKIVAVDISGEMLRRAEARARSLRLDNLIYRKADAEELSRHFNEESFDAVVCCNGLPNFPHQRRALVEMASLVRENGVLALSTVNRDKCDENPLLRWMLRFPPGRFPYSADYEAWLRESGFTKMEFNERGMMLIIRAVR